ncbi:MAG: hypothetical protein ACU0BF_00620 [Paracoccaceae bacterium]
MSGGSPAGIGAPKPVNVNPQPQGAGNAGKGVEQGAPSSTLATLDKAAAPPPGARARSNSAPAALVVPNLVPQQALAAIQNAPAAPQANRAQLPEDALNWLNEVEAEEAEAVETGANLRMRTGNEIKYQGRFVVPPAPPGEPKPEPMIVSGKDLMDRYGLPERESWRGNQQDTRLHQAAALLDGLANKLAGIDMNMHGLSDSRTDGINGVISDIEAAETALSEQLDKFERKANRWNASDNAENRFNRLNSAVTDLSKDLKDLKAALNLMSETTKYTGDMSGTDLLKAIMKSGAKTPEQVGKLLMDPIATHDLKPLSGGTVSEVFADFDNGKVYKLLNDGVAMPKELVGVAKQDVNALGRNKFAHMADVAMSGGDPGRVQTTPVSLVMTDKGPAIEMNLMGGRGVRETPERYEFSKDGGDLFKPTFDSAMQTRAMGDDMAYNVCQAIQRLVPVSDGGETILAVAGEPYGAAEFDGRPDLLQGAVDLVWKDLARGQVDRHCGNIRLDLDAGRVLGIDEDLCGGTHETIANGGGTTRGHPPYISREMFDAVKLHLDELRAPDGDEPTETFKTYIDLMGSKEANAFVARLEDIVRLAGTDGVEVLAPEAWKARTSEIFDGLTVLDKRGYMSDVTHIGAMEYEHMLQQTAFAKYAYTGDDL